MSGFYRIGENIIDWVKQPDSVKWESANITELQTWGFESSAGFTIEKLHWTVFPLLSINASYSYLNSTKNSGSFLSYYVMDYLKHKLTICENVILYKKIGGTIEFSYNFRNGSYIDFKDGLEKKYKSYNTTDVKVFWRPLNFDIYISCNNFFNQRYIDFGNIEMPGIWVFGGVNYKFDFSKKTKKNA